MLPIVSRTETVLRLVAYCHGTACQIDVIPRAVITSCSRIPVIRKNTNHSRSCWSHAAKSLSRSSCSYTSGSSSTKRGQSFLPTKARIPCALRNDISVHAARRLVLLITEERGELQHVTSLNVVNVQLRAIFSEIIQRGRVCGQGLRLLGKLGVSSRNSATATASDLCPLPPFSGASFRWRRLHLSTPTTPLLVALSSATDRRTRLPFSPHSR